MDSGHFGQVTKKNHIYIVLSTEYSSVGLTLALWLKKDHKAGQGQPRFIICANLVGPTSPMLHTKSQGR